MADNILDSYFVRIAALPDTKSFVKAGMILARTELSIAGVAKSALKSVIAFEAASVTAFAAIGVGLVSLADKTAMTDQQYRLMGIRMLMTKSSARAMQQALDELGATIDEVAMDPELNARFQYLYNENIRLGKQLGGDFDVIQRNVRDIRMEYKRFGNELEVLSYRVISDLFEKLGFGNEDLLKKLQNLNEWFTENLPEISNEISTEFIPIWNDAVIVLKDFGDVVEIVVGNFQLLTGVLMDDDALKNTQVSVKSLIEMFHDWVDWIAKATLGIQFLAKAFSHSVTAGGYFIEEMKALSRGDAKSFSEYKKLQEGETGEGWSDIKGLLTGNIEGLKDASGLSSYFASQQGRLGVSHDTPGNLVQLIDSTAKKYNINPELLAAITHQEDPSHDPGAVSPKKAMGLMQLMPATAKQYGVTNPFNPEQNMDAGAHFFSDMLKKYHYDIPKALAAYNAGPGNVDKYGGVPPFSETQQYVSRIMRNFSDLSSASAAQGGAVVIDTVNINVPHNLPENKWSQFVKDSFKEQTDKATRNTTAQTAGGAYR
jgi:soluble lytic murein transglycosylase-like protein